MAPEVSIDLIKLERQLHDLSVAIRKIDAHNSWLAVETASRELANNLRVRGGAADNHTILGKTELPQTLTSLLASALQGSQIPVENRSASVLELLRAGANLCMDHNENRAALLEVGFPQAVLTLLEGYAEAVSSPPDMRPLPLSIPHLKIVRTSIGVLLNASIGFDPVKFRLISLEATLTIIKLSSTIYPPTSWTSYQNNFSEESFTEEWTLRSGISNWAWRTVSALKDVQDESLQIINSAILPWITAPLLKFCPPYSLELSPLFDSDPDMLDTLVQIDFEFLEESCTLIESLSLDVEDVRLELGRAMCYPTVDKPLSCLAAILDFIEYGSYSPLWRSPIFDETDIKNKEKAFDICKAALIKSVVEVFGEEKNEDILWNEGNPEHPAGLLVERLVNWIKRFTEKLDAGDKIGVDRDDLAICASLSLGNLARKANVVTTLLSPPYSLAPVLSSTHFFSRSTDIKLKHGILGLLKHLSQFAKLSPIIPKVLAEVRIIERIAASGILDEKSDAMADVIQLSAIGVCKHMCNGNLDHTFALVLPNGDNNPTGLSQILALIKRSDSISIKSEGSRVLVNAVKSLWFSERTLGASDERQRKKDQCISILLTPQCAQTLTALIARSNRYPILVNEGIVAISLLSTHKLGGPLVLEALTTPLNGNLSTEEPSSANSEASSSLPTPSSRSDGLLVPRDALDMLVFALRNVDNPVNFPLEVRVNICTFFLQLQRHSLPPLARVRNVVVPVVEQVAEDSEDVEGEEKLTKAAKLLFETWTGSQTNSG